MIGHHEITKRLFGIVSMGWDIGASLFHGPPSVGKRTVAFNVARSILCLGSKLEDCRCKSCVRFPDHPDFMCVGRSSGVKVSDIDAVLSFVSTAPFMSEKRVVVVDNAEAMSWEASNRLLGVLEKPSTLAVFFLVSSDPDRILPTVRSRCVPFRFGSLGREDMVNILWKKMGYDLSIARTLGWIACSSGSDVFSDPGSYLPIRDMAVDFISTMKGKDSLESLDFIDRVEKKNLYIFSDMLMLCLTDMLILKESVGDVINADIRAKLEKVCEDMDIKILLFMTSVFSQVGRHKNLHVNVRMILKSCLLKVYPLISPPARVP